ncbi:hypothetical protein [Allochromatium palmeri]|uniref:Uncharacterized protein n=1 Tax=Allochromatium palmeri TaxID=231048 RepID=A0A6N8EG12_9GAMM|nr:hypothetical protein [Allochromatium palmeri]MTW22601.1 hypothetical protein [Allochromatium palmeri]
MKNLHLTTPIGADGLLHIPVAEFANQDVEVIVLPVTHKEARSFLVGQDALKKALEIGYIGSFEAEPDFSARYKNHLDWSRKAKPSVS